MKINKKGFTAIELLISLAIMSIAMTSIYSLYMSFIRTCTKEGAKIRVQQSVRSGLDMMVRDIRLVGLDPEGTGDFGMIAVTSQRIQFTADRDMDGELDDADATDGIDGTDMEHMAYEYDGTGKLKMYLYKANGNPEMDEIMAENVTDLTFTYFDSNDDTTSNLDEIRTVDIRMTIQKPSGQDGEISRTLVKRVKCRNLEYQ
ncbi:MAG: prepilin-type N-terminal cleavage/methylation domain-containing protein [Desulfobacteraceae bacterium]|nr:prepilin-type N-terminal cleavage/methylation domain-containing protein [Desulfobacteraceae bacterium]